MEGWLLTLGCGAVLLVLAIDRVMRRSERGDGQGDRRRRSTTVTGGPGFGDLVEIFQPTARFRHEEQERKRHELVQPGDAAPDWDVDLDAGVVRQRPAGVDDGSGA